MRDLGTKMAELKFEAPLAKFEESDEWGGCDFITSSHHHHHHHHQQQQQQQQHHYHHHHHHIHQQSQQQQPLQSQQQQQQQQQQQHRHRHQLQSSLNDALNLNIKDATTTQEVKLRLLEEAVRDAHVSRNGSEAVNLCVNANINGNGNGNGNVNGIGINANTNTTTTTINNGGGGDSGSISPNCNSQFGGELGGGGFELASATITGVDVTADRRIIDNVDNFTETFGGSLEDLVNTFDEKITKCFGNYEENVEELAPVQVRSQEEIMNECQMWWTITGNFGNILPIDWSKSYTRQMHMPTLNLGNKMKTTNGSMNSQNENGLDGGGDGGGGGGGLGNGVDELNDLSSEDEAVANDLDMHALILNGMTADGEEPIKTVEEVIKEIDDIMDEAESPLDEVETCDTEVMEKAKEVLGASLHAEKLQYLTIVQLNELFMEMEMLIQEFSETLINELALRDELEFEKELKNTFISLLLAVQNKRRQYHVEKKRGKLQGAEPKYLTTVIPYHLENGTPNNQSLQVLIKILKAINEDSPAVPALLTDYILKVLCPT